jgi:hypothetical protein
MIYGIGAIVTVTIIVICCIIVGGRADGKNNK